MDLRKLKEALSEGSVLGGQLGDVNSDPSKEFSPGWDFADVTIIKNSPPGDGGGGKKVKPKPGSSKVEQPNDGPPPPPQPGKKKQKQKGDGDGDGEGEGDGESGELKPGAVIQDNDTKEYGEVTKVYPNGDIDWRPLTDEEVKARTGAIKFASYNPIKMNLPSFGLKNPMHDDDSRYD